MLHLLDDSLEAFLRDTVPLQRREIDVAFEAPDRDWAARVSRPTVNLYLWDVRHNLDERSGGVEVVTGENGRPHRRRPLPRIDCRYLVTAWTSEVRDEHSLLGATLCALLLHSELDQKYLPAPYAAVQPWPTIQVASNDATDNSDFWSALGGQLKPGLDLVVTATVDAALLVAAGPAVQRYTIRTKTTAEGAEASGRLLVGGRTTGPEGTLVTTPRGSAWVDADGAFLVPAEPGDEVTVDGTVRGRVQDRGEIDLTQDGAAGE